MGEHIFADNDHGIQLTCSIHRQAVAKSGARIPQSTENFRAPVTAHWHSASQLAELLFPACVAELACAKHWGDGGRPRSSGAPWVVRRNVGSV